MLKSGLGLLGWRQPKTINLAFFDDARSGYPIAQMVEKLAVERLAQLERPDIPNHFFFSERDSTAMQSLFGQSGLSRLAENDLFNEISESSRRNLLDAFPGVRASEIPLERVVAEMTPLPSLKDKASAWLKLNPEASLTVWRDGPASAIPKSLVEHYLPPGTRVKNVADLFIAAGKNSPAGVSPNELPYSEALRRGHYPEAERYFSAEISDKTSGHVVSFWQDPQALPWPPPRPEPPLPLASMVSEGLAGDVSHLPSGYDTLFAH
ncbi:hypothetical protein FHS85_002963 [Rhodoligotrophos appendicifer]|uniref:hypothetical protein n=1 Tax=Rhodoligotrophos appendicifer TaxID=987056 RepID=UPI0011854633|nr:hypothetical protein [Rhodoligotrophos appendicifer]